MMIADSEIQYQQDTVHGHLDTVNEHIHTQAAVTIGLNHYRATVKSVILVPSHESCWLLALVS